MSRDVIFIHIALARLTEIIAYFYKLLSLFLHRLCTFSCNTCLKKNTAEQNTGIKQLIDLATSTNTHSAQGQFLVHHVQLQTVQVLALIIVDYGNISFTFWQLEKRKLTFNHLGRFYSLLTQPTDHRHCGFIVCGHCPLVVITGK